MFKHFPSISDAQYFLSHETVCWMVMAKRWKASNVPTSSTCYRLLLNILNLHGIPKCERSKAHSKSYRRMFPVSSARSKWKNLSWNRVFQHEKILSSQFSDPKILGWNIVEQVSQSFLIQLPWPPCAANVFMISGQCMTCSATALVHSSPIWMISPRFPAYLATPENGVGFLGNTDTW